MTTTLTFADWLVVFSGAFMGAAAFYFGIQLWRAHLMRQEIRIKKIVNDTLNRQFMAGVQFREVPLTKELVVQEAEFCRNNGHINDTVYYEVLRMVDDNDLEGAYAHLNTGHMN